MFNRIKINSKSKGFRDSSGSPQNDVPCHTFVSLRASSEYFRRHPERSEGSHSIKANSKFKRFKHKGLSLAEMLLTLVITSILLIAAFPLFSLKAPNKGDDFSSITCIKAELAENLSSTACSQAITNCKYDRNNACRTISFLANHGSGDVTSGERVAARKLLIEICDQGGEAACKYFIEDCQKDSSNCNVAGSNYDLNYYLNLLTSNPTNGRIRIEDLCKSFYNIGYPNIVNAVDTVCPSCGVSTACAVKGAGACPTPPDPACGAEDIGSIRVSKCNNTYNLVANNVGPNGAGCWEGLNTVCTGTGCSRPVCNWTGAEQACIALNGGVDYGAKNWRLPTRDEMQNWRVTYDSNSAIIAEVKTAMDLCDYSSGYSPYCNYYSGCSGSNGSYCYPYRLWSVETSGSSYYRYSLHSGNWDGPNSFSPTYAFSARCVKSL